MVVYPEDIFCQMVKAEDVPHLVEEHFIKGRPVKKVPLHAAGPRRTPSVMNEIPFFKHQVLRALDRSLIDAEKIEEYIARDGYLAAAKALTEMTPEQIVNGSRTQGFAAGGGAGFPDGAQVGALRTGLRQIQSTSCATATRRPRRLHGSTSIMEQTPARSLKV